MGLNSDEESTWALTFFGKRKLKTMNMLHKPRHVYKPREGVALRDLHVIELRDSLSSIGWECRVLVRKLRAKTAKNKDVKQAAELEDVQPVDYVDKGRKLWWLRPAMKCALLLAEEHKHPVPHFRSSSFYQALIDGRPPPQRKSRKSMFDFEPQLANTPAHCLTPLPVQRGRGRG